MALLCRPGNRAARRVVSSQLKVTPQSRRNSTWTQAAAAPWPPGCRLTLRLLWPPLRALPWCPATPCAHPPACGPVSCLRWRLLTLLLLARLAFFISSVCPCSCSDFWHGGAGVQPWAPFLPWLASALGVSSGCRVLNVLSQAVAPCLSAAQNLLLLVHLVHSAAYLSLRNERTQS